MIFNMS